MRIGTKWIARWLMPVALLATTPVMTGCEKNYHAQKSSSISAGGSGGATRRSRREAYAAKVAASQAAKRNPYGASAFGVPIQQYGSAKSGKGQQATTVFGQPKKKPARKRTTIFDATNRKGRSKPPNPFAGG